MAALVWQCGSIVNRACSSHCYTGTSAVVHTKSNLSLLHGDARPSFEAQFFLLGLQWLIQLVPTNQRWCIIANSIDQYCVNTKHLHRNYKCGLCFKRTLHVYAHFSVDRVGGVTMHPDNGNAKEMLQVDTRHGHSFYAGCACLHSQISGSIAQH